MKRFLCAIAIFAITLSLAGCYAAFKKYYRDIEDYEVIWELPGQLYGRNGREKQTYLFPESIDNLEVLDFYCRYDELIPITEATQVFLEVQYSSEAFLVEVDRILAMSTDVTEHFELKDVSIYATVFKTETTSYEYAIVDSTNYKVIYAYVDGIIPAEQIRFDKKYLPTKYVESHY